MNTTSNPTRAAMRAVRASYTPGISTAPSATASRIRWAPVIRAYTCGSAAAPSDGPFLLMSTSPGTAENPLRVAIVGSGPAGFYAAGHLLRSKDHFVQVDVYDRLPTPWGLVRAG